VRRRAEQLVLQVPLKPLIDREGNDQGSHSGGYSDYRNDRDYADDGLTAFGAQVAGSYKQFKLHAPPSARRGLLMDLSFEARPWNQGNTRFVLAKALAKPLLQFTFFYINHDREGDESVNCQQHINH